MPRSLDVVTTNLIRMDQSLSMKVTKPVLRAAVVIQSGGLENISPKVSGMKTRFLWAQVALGNCKSVENLKVRKRMVSFTNYILLYYKIFTRLRGPGDKM